MTDYTKEPVFMDDAEWIDADYQITARETRWVENKIFEVSRQRAVAQKVFKTVKIPRGRKEWIVEIESEGEAPIFTDNFLKEDQHEVRKSENTFYPVFMHHDYVIGMVDADGVENSKFHDISLAAQTVRNLTGSIADYREKVIWRGYDIAGRDNAAPNNQGSIDTASLGIINTSGINTFNAGDGDQDIQVAGDGVVGLTQAAASLITDDFYGPYHSFMTPEVYSELLGNLNATTQRSDITLMKELIDPRGSKLSAGIHVTKHLLPTVEASSTEANWVVIDPKDLNGNPTILIGEEYPLMNFPNPQRAAIAASGKIVWAGIPAVLRPEAITLAENIVYA